MKLITQSLIQQFSLRRFLIFAEIILAVTGVAKIVTITGDTTLLQVTDPIFGIEFQYLMGLVGVAELLVAAYCLFSKRETVSVILVAWLASCFLAYRIGIHLSDWERPCGCLGNLTDVLRISPQAAEVVSVGLLGFLLLGSYGVVFGTFSRKLMFRFAEE